MSDSELQQSMLKQMNDLLRGCGVAPKLLADLQLAIDNITLDGSPADLDGDDENGGSQSN